MECAAALPAKEEEKVIEFDAATLAKRAKRKRARHADRRPLQARENTTRDARSLPGEKAADEVRNLNEQNDAKSKGKASPKKAPRRTKTSRKAEDDPMFSDL